MQCTSSNYCDKCVLGLINSNGKCKCESDYYLNSEEPFLEESIYEEDSSIVIPTSYN